jgi:hypothetical protein
MTSGEAARAEATQSRIDQVKDHMTPRSGILADGYFRRTRSSDGSTYLWLARKCGSGQGPGWSGLRYDVVRAEAAAPSS